jgi:hypothetical protein
MNDIVSKLKTPRECEILEKNALERGNSELALAARKRAVELRAQAHGASTDAERECLEAVYAYERVLFQKHGKNIRAAYTWRMMKQRGIIAAVERTVSRKEETVGYRALVEMGLEDYAFEAVVVRYPALFSPEAVRISQERINTHDQT